MAKVRREKTSEQSSTAFLLKFKDILLGNKELRSLLNFYSGGVKGEWECATTQGHDLCGPQTHG